jgi:hypothetical protein
MATRGLVDEAGCAQSAAQLPNRSKLWNTSSTGVDAAAVLAVSKATTSNAAIRMNHPARLDTIYKHSIAARIGN